MMQRTTLLLLAAVVTATTASASADPACSVDLVRVPDDVRAVVEHWVSAEPHCAHALSVRIVPTEGGLYLLVRDERGRERERLVPDPTSAAVLIASWAADDQIVPVAVPPEVVAAIDPPSMHPQLVVAVTPASSAPDLDLRIGAIAQLTTSGSGDQSSNYGGRIERDLWAHRGWVIDAAMTVSDAKRDTWVDHVPFTPQTYDHISMSSLDASAVINIARPLRYGAWELRPAIGAGILYTYAEVTSPQASASGSGVSPIGEASLELSYRFAPNLAVTVGPIGRWFNQKLDSSEVMVYHLTRDVDLIAFAGLRWGL